MSLNDEFLEKITKSFQTYLDSKPRSNKKLKVIHPFIADSLINKFNNPQLKSYSLRERGESKEIGVDGKYYKKKVDIAICDNNDQVICAVGFKFIMSNYKQNSNNYFENMLGETANIRCSSIPYFQILIFPIKLPYFDEHGNITHWEEMSEHNIRKYKELYFGDLQNALHVPVYTLLYFIKFEECIDNIVDKSSYANYFKEKHVIVDNTFNDFPDNLIVNDFETFIEKVKNAVDNSNSENN